MVDWGPVLTGLGIVGGALLIFLAFVAITLFISRRRHRRLLESETEVSV